jgi:hypothetical protein
MSEFEAQRWYFPEIMDAEMAQIDQDLDEIMAITAHAIQSALYNVRE